MKKFLLYLIATLSLPLCAYSQTVIEQDQTLEVNNGGDVLLTWSGISDRTYFMQWSPDLVKWNYFPVIESGTGSALSYGFNSTSDKLFLRLKYQDGLVYNVSNADFDNDGISNETELLNGTDPNILDDKDEDGIPDGYDKNPDIDGGDDWIRTDVKLQRRSESLSIPLKIDGNYNNDGSYFATWQHPAILHTNPDYSDVLVSGGTIQNWLYIDPVLFLEGPGPSLGLWPASHLDTGNIDNHGWISSSDNIPQFPAFKAAYLTQDWMVENVGIGDNNDTYEERRKGIAHGQIRLKSARPVQKAYSRNYLKRLQRVTEVRPILNGSGNTITTTDYEEFLGHVKLTIPLNHRESPIYTINPPIDSGYTNITAPAMDKETRKSETIKLLRIDIAALKDGEVNPPENGLIVEKTDTIRYRISPDLPDSPVLFEDKIQWYWRILKWDGTYESWTPFQDGQGHTFTAQPQTAGIYEIKANFDGHDYFLSRKKDDDHSRKEAGDNDCIGICDEEWQLEVFQQANLKLGATTYAEVANYPPLPPNSPKCNLFVAHMASGGGAMVPWINGGAFFIGTTYPPVANQWAGTEVATIPNWTLMPTNSYPQPGWIVARGRLNGTGHTGIVAYDGAWISAGTHNINRLADIRSEGYQPARFQKYNP